MNEKYNKPLLVAIFLVFSIFIAVVFLRNNHYFFAAMIAIAFVLMVISSRIQKTNNKKELYERLGITTDDEFSLLLCNFEELVTDKLYIKDEMVININSYKCYYLYEIKNMEKIHHHNRNSTFRSDTYELKVIAETAIDTLYFDTSINARDCAYLLLSRKIAESKKEETSDICEEIVSHELPYSEDEYDGYIMDEEDIKNKENRNDWLGSI